MNNKSKKHTAPPEISSVEDLVYFCCRCHAPLGGEAPVLGLHADCYSKAFPKADPEQGISKLRKLKTGTESHESCKEDVPREKQYLGHYPKYALRLGGEEYIAKIGKTDKYPLIALTEKLCNDVASHLGIDVPEYHLIRFKDRPCFLVKNFLSHREFSNLIHVAQYWPKKSDGTLEECLLETLIEIVRDQVGYQAVRKVVEVVIFDYLIGNSDRHRENFGFVRKRGSLTLSPIYDSVSELGTEPEELLDPNDKHHPALFILVKNQKEMEIFEYIKPLYELGLAKETSNFVSKIKRQNKKILQTIDTSLTTPNLKASFRGLVQRRTDELAEAIKEMEGEAS